MPDNIQLLKLAVKKWHAVAFKEAEEDAQYDCHLCEAYRGDGLFSILCEGCPIKEKTGQTGCRGTPYESWAGHHRKVHDAHTGLFVHCPECKRLAVAELVFLENLLKEEEKKMGMGDRLETQAEREAEKKAAWMDEQAYALARDFIDQEHILEHLAKDIAFQELLHDEFQEYCNDMWEARK